MTTPDPTPHTARRSTLLALPLLGALPGLVLILVAQLVMRGATAQLTVGVAGMWLAVVGGAVGALAAGRRIWRHRTRR